MEYKINVLTIHEVGKRINSEGQPHQEDSIYPARGKESENDRLFILCDGMGGHAAGEIASQTVCNVISHIIKENDKPFSDDLLLHAIGQAYNKLDQIDSDSSGTHRMGTTLALLALHGAGATIAHIGDSRVYHLRPNAEHKDEVLFRTRDHSLVNDLIKIGSITPEEAKHHPQKNVITRAMQPHQENRSMPDIYHTDDVRAGDYFFLCSDGMLEEMEDRNVCNILGDNATDEAKVMTLKRVTSGNSDNHSAIVVHVKEVMGTADKIPASSGSNEMPTSSQVKPKTNLGSDNESKNDIRRNSPSQQQGKDNNETAGNKKSKHKFSWVMVFLMVVVMLFSILLFLGKDGF